MKWIHVFASAAFLTVSTSALAQSDAYKAGYTLGQQVGRFAAQFIPVVVIILVIAVAWTGYRAWRRRGTSHDGQI